MRAGLGVTAIAVAGAALVAAAIVTHSPDQSRVPSGAAGPARPSDELLPFTWHDSPRPIDDLAFTDRGGNPMRLSDFRGRVVLVNLWATWCAPCLREMPMLDALARAAAGPGLAVIALNQDRGGIAAAGPFWDDHGFDSLELALDPGFAAGRALEAKGLPLTVLIDRQGRELARLEGIASWDARQVIAYFKALAAASG